MALYLGPILLVTILPVLALIIAAGILGYAIIYRDHAPKSLLLHTGAVAILLLLHRALDKIIGLGIKNDPFELAWWLPKVAMTTGSNITFYSILIDAISLIGTLLALVVAYHYGLRRSPEH